MASPPPDQVDCEAAHPFVELLQPRPASTPKESLFVRTCRKKWQCAMLMLIILLGTVELLTTWLTKLDVDVLNNVTQKVFSHTLDLEHDQ